MEMVLTHILKITLVIFMVGNLLEPPQVTVVGQPR
jgi:hypothetical protein